MIGLRWRLGGAAIGLLLALSGPPAMAQAQAQKQGDAAKQSEGTPKRGGTLTYMIPADAPPSMDGHRETTYATVHTGAPFYSVLIRVNPDDPASTTDFVCDLCTEMPKPTDGGKTYTFKIRQGIKFHDGSPLTAADVAKSWQMIVFPPKGILSPRQANFDMVEAIENPDPETVVFRLKFPTTAFLPALSDPFAWIYKKEILEKDPHWYEKNIMGSGPFKFAGYEVGQSISGVRNPDYYMPGKPYLDGIEGIYAPKQATRIEAIRGDRAAIEFRGLPPASRDELKKELGDKIAVQESDWNCGSVVTINHAKKPFDDPRVRRALTLAIDRWNGAKALSKIANVRTVGSIIFPTHPLAPTQEQLHEVAGYWTDIEKSRAEAKRLLKGGRGREPRIRAAEPRRRSAVQICRHLARRRVAQDRSQGHPACPAERPVDRRRARRRFRRRSAGQLPQRRQPARRRNAVPAGVARELRQLQG